MDMVDLNNVQDLCNICVRSLSTGMSIQMQRRGRHVAE